jgi:hypothetical protein
MNSTFQNAAQVLSIGIFFTLMIIGLAATLPASLYHGLVLHGLPVVSARKASHLPPVSTLFAAFLGYSPVQHLVGSSVLSHLSISQRNIVIGRGFFPSIIATPFRNGLHAAFSFAIGACLVAAGASWLRGGKFVYSESGTPGTSSGSTDAVDAVAVGESMSEVAGEREGEGEGDRRHQPASAP